MKWPTCPLDKVADVYGGSTPSRNRSEYWDGDIPWLTPTDLPKPGTEIADVFNTTSHITRDGLQSCSANLLPIGTVLYSSRATIGKIGIARVPLATNQGFVNFIPKPGVDSKYLAYVLSYFTTEISTLAGSTTFKEVSRGVLRKYKVPLPSPTEQRRIVDILDLADALRKKRAQADEKASRVLQALFYKMFGDPATNPKGWPVVPITELVDGIERRDPSLQPKEPFFYIDIAGVDGQLGAITGARKLIGSEAPGRARQIISANDVLISTVRPYLRGTALVPAQYDNQICSTGFSVLRAKGGSGFGFLYALSRLQWFTDQLTARARGASYPAVTDTDILGLPVPHPNDVDSLKTIDRQILDYLVLKEKQREVGTRIALLFEVLLHRAFSGDLTAKWREAHMKELLVEMEEQDRFLKTRSKEVAND